MAPKRAFDHLPLIPMDASAPRSTTVDDLARGVQSVQAFVQSVQAFARSVQSLPDERTVRRMKRDMARLRIATARLAARGDGATAAAARRNSRHRFAP